MSKFEEAFDKYKAAFEGLSSSVNEDLLKSIAKGLGPSIYLQDASLVSCSDPDELARVKDNFLIKKLGLENGENLDAAIKAVCEKYSGSNRKHRAVFYYLLVEHLGVQDKIQ